MEIKNAPLPERAKVKGLIPEMVLAAVIVDQVFREKGRAGCTITSGSDGVHKAPNSLHYRAKKGDPAGTGCAALDFRTRDLPLYTIQEVVSELESRLGADFQVVAEGDHIHVEFDPR